MEVDGLLLNFAPAAGAESQVLNFKGGRWKDRRIARKIAVKRAGRVDGEPAAKKQRVEDQHENGQLNGNESQSQAYKRWQSEQRERPARKDNRQQGGFARNDHERQKGYGRQQQDGRTQQRNDRAPRQIVSSLFSFNPEVKETENEKEEERAPTNAPIPGNQFSALGLNASLSTHLTSKMELQNPTAIQTVTIPKLLEEDGDAFVQAQTGSGKTLAFLLPLLHRLQASKLHRDSGLFAVILSPTRELCKQISAALDNLLRCSNWLVAGTVIGGERKKSEKARLRKGVNILVATPGRLVDHIANTERLDLSQVRWLVLDEGDRLMELGFEDEIKGIVERLEKQSSFKKVEGLPDRRITVLCSATMKMNVQRLGEISLKDATFIKAEGSSDENTGQDTFSAPAQLKQSVVIVPSKLRLVTLTALLKKSFSRKGSVMKAIVFFSCADSVDFHFSVFEREYQEKEESETAEKPPPKDSTGTVAQAPHISSPTNPVIMIHKLHGSLAQPVRTSTLQSFSSSKLPSILLCTDVASRGLDLPNVDLVIEYDPAFSRDDHLHRVGRTARAGKDGKATLFLLPGPEEGYGDFIESKTRIAYEELLRNSFGGQKNYEDAATTFQLDVERWVLASPKHLEAARRAYQSHLRAYATHIATERGFFDLKALHLGHLAKAFGLRDRPTGMGIPGQRPRADTGSGKRNLGNSGKRGKKGNKDDDEDERDETSREELARKMKKKMRSLEKDLTGEFNIG